MRSNMANDADEYCYVRVEYLAYQGCFGTSELRRNASFCNETFQTKTANLHALSHSAEKRRQYCL